MKKHSLLLFLALCAISVNAFASEVNSQEEEQKEKTRLEGRFEAEEPQGEVLARRIDPTQDSADKEKINLEEFLEKMQTDNFVEQITATDMQERLQNNAAAELLYLKVNEETVLVYKDLLGDRAACTQLIYASPKEHIINVYTNNPNLSKQLWRIVKYNKDERNNAGGYTLVGDKSPDAKLENGGFICKFWYEKIKSQGHRVRRGSGLGLPISIGASIPIGGGRHRPHIGIGL